MSDFLSKDYKLPETSNYMKFQEGENTFRVLSSAIVGYEYFTKDNKPVRSREPFPTYPADIRDGGEIKHFWAFVVWNYSARKLQILSLTQKTIMSAIVSLVRNPKWGNPSGYDITITRKGSGMDTEYTVVPEPHSPVAEDIKKTFMENRVNLNALYEGEDPFDVPRSKEEEEAMKHTPF